MELSGGLESVIAPDIYTDHPCLKVLMEVDQDAPADSIAALSIPISALTIKEEPEAPPSPHATPTAPFTERSLTPEEPAVDAPAPAPPAPPPPASSAAPPPGPPPASPTASPPGRRRTRAAAKPAAASPKAGRAKAPPKKKATKKKKAGKGKVPALTHNQFARAWEVRRATNGKDPRSGVKSDSCAGRKENFDYYELFDESPKLLFACACYPKTFPLWVVREGFLLDHPSMIAKDRIPSKATLSRAVNKFKAGG